MVVLMVGFQGAVFDMNVYLHCSRDHFNVLHLSLLTIGWWLRLCLKGLINVTAFAIFFKRLLLHQLNSKNNGPVLSVIKTIFGH